MNKGYWLWGGFELNDQNLLSKNILKLSNILDGPYFNPHLTLFGPIKKLDDKKRKDLKDFCRYSKPIKIRFSRLEMGNEKYKSIFFTIHKNNKFLQFRSNLLDLIPLISKDDEYFPHVSVFYGKRENSKKIEAIKKICTEVASVKLEKVFYTYVNESRNQWIIEEEFRMNC